LEEEQEEEEEEEEEEGKAPHSCTLTRARKIFTPRQQPQSEGGRPKPRPFNHPANWELQNEAVDDRRWPPMSWLG
jgi:hypothetical protein